MSDSAPRWVKRRLAALVADGIALPLLVGILGDQDGLVTVVVLIHAALGLGLIRAMRAESGLWFALLVPANVGMLLVTWGTPLVSVALLVGLALILERGHSPGTFVGGFRVVAFQGAATPRALYSRNILAMVQATGVWAGAGAALTLWATLVGGGLPAVAGLLVLVVLLVTGLAVVPRGLVDLVFGTALEHRPGTRIPGPPINIYGSALWGSTRADDLDLSPPAAGDADGPSPAPGADPAGAGEVK